MTAPLTTQATADLIDAINGDAVTWAQQNPLPTCSSTLAVHLSPTSRLSISAGETDHGPYAIVSLDNTSIHLCGDWDDLVRFAQALLTEVGEVQNAIAEADHSARHSYEIDPGYEMDPVGLLASSVVDPIAEAFDTDPTTAALAAEYLALTDALDRAECAETWADPVAGE